MIRDDDPLLILKLDNVQGNDGAVGSYSIDRQVYPGGTGERRGLIFINVKVGEDPVSRRLGSLPDHTLPTGATCCLIGKASQGHANAIQESTTGKSHRLPLPLLDITLVVVLIDVSTSSLGNRSGPGCTFAMAGVGRPSRSAM